MLSDWLRSVTAVVILAGGTSAQPPAARPAFESFEVATVKPTPPEWTRGRYVRMQTAHQLEAKNYELRVLIAFAFGLSPQAISGVPAWIDSDHYDILAETPGEVRPSLEEQMAMLRKLLTDRFRLTFHREQKEFSVYALTVAKGGSKLKESALPDATPEGPPPLVFVIAPDSVRLPGRYASMGELAAVMQRTAVDRPVLDRTGLTGRYDFDLEWTPDDTQFGGLGLWKNVESPKPDLFAAIQRQLGLRLEATKGPVESLVIDRIDRPTEN